MFKSIKNAFTWLKNKTFKLWKVIATIIGIGAIAYAGTEIANPPPVGEYKAPEVEVNGEIIRFLYTDDNTDEDLIISTDREIYSGLGMTETDIYVAIDDKSGKNQDVNLQSFFSKDDRKVVDVARLEKDVAPYDCSYWIPSFSEEDKPIYIKKTCTDKWVSQPISDFSAVENEQLITAQAITVKDKKNFTAKKKLQFLLTQNEIAYFKIHIEFPAYIEDEFFIEVIGNEKGYGHLDPTINSNILQENWANVTGWTDGDTNGAESSISPAGQLYLDLRALTDIGQTKRYKDFGSIGTGDYWVEMKFKGDVWDKYDTTYVGLGVETYGETNYLTCLIGNDATDGDGIWVHDGSSFVKVLTKTWAADTWYTIKYHVHNSQTDVDIYVDGTKEVTDADCSKSSANDGLVNVDGYGSVDGNGEYHIDYLYVGTRGRRIIIID